MHKYHEEIQIEKERIDTDTYSKEQEQNTRTLAERQFVADSEKAKVEQKYSVSAVSLEEMMDNERLNHIKCIDKIYDESIELFQKGEKERAIAKLKEGAELDASYYLAWLGLLQVHTEDFTNLQNFENLADIYNKSILAMNEEQKKECLWKYGPQLQKRIDRYEETYKVLEREDEQLRQAYQPKYNLAWKKSKPIFWILLASMALCIIAMSVTWPFLHFVSGDWIAYLAIICTVLAGISFLLFVLIAFRFAYLYHKKNFCERLGNSIYGEDMRKVAKECEKYKILLEDISNSAE